jgi:hypothetical protein
MDPAIQDILDDPRQIRLMRGNVSIQAPMECHSAWSDLAWKSAAMATDGATNEIRIQGVKVLLMMAGIKADVMETTRKWCGGNAPAVATAPKDSAS